MRLLIYETPADLEKADREGLTDRIINFMTEYCRNRTHGGIIYAILSLSEITTKEALRAQGSVMGIKRKKTDFTEW